MCKNYYIISAARHFAAKCALNKLLCLCTINYRGDFMNEKRVNFTPIIITVIIAFTAVIITCIICVFGWVKKIPAVFSHSVKEGYTEIDGSKEFDVSSLNGIEINWVSGNVNIEYYDGDKIYVEETGNNIKYKMCYKTSVGELEIDEYAFNGSTSVREIGTKNLTVKIPQSFSMADFKIEVVSANVTATDIKTDDFEFDTVSGNGDFSFASSPREIETESVSGSVSITLPDDAQGYNAKLNSVSGTLTAADFDNALSFGGGYTKISCDSVSGDVKLKKAS